MTNKPPVTLRQIDAFIGVISELHHVELMCARFLNNGVIYDDNKADLLRRLDRIKISVGRIDHLTD